MVKYIEKIPLANDPSVQKDRNGRIVQDKETKEIKYSNLSPLDKFNPKKNKI